MTQSPAASPAGERDLRSAHDDPRLLRVLGTGGAILTVLAVTIGAGIYSVPQRVALNLSSVPEILLLWGAMGTCCVVHQNGILVHATWIDTGRAWVEYLRGYLLLAPEDIYELDGYTHPDYRGHRLLWLCNAFARRHYRQRGFRRMLGAVAVENTASLRAMELVGHHSIGLYGCWRLGPWQRDWAQAFGDEYLPPLERPGTETMPGTP